MLSTDSENLYDYEKGIAVAGKIRDDWMANEYDGKSEITPNDPANWNQEGMAGEKGLCMLRLFQQRRASCFTAGGAKSCRRIFCRS